jgi:hypothetical protein
VGQVPTDLESLAQSAPHQIGQHKLTGSDPIGRLFETAGR